MEPPSVPQPPVPPAQLNGIPAAGPSLSYARSDDSWIRPTSITLGVSKAALIVAILHAVAAFFIALFLGFEARFVSHGEELVVSLCLLQAPLLIAVLILGVLGHRPIGGRRWAGPAMWITSVTPGASSLLLLLVALINGDEANRGLAWGVVVVAAVNAAIVLSLRNRILKDPGPLPVIPLSEPFPMTPTDPRTGREPPAEVMHS